MIRIIIKFISTALLPTTTTTTKNSELTALNNLNEAHVDTD